MSGVVAGSEKAGSAGVKKRERVPAGPQVYVVQRLASRASGSPVAWEDVATVTVPPRSKRRTIIAAALATEAGKQLALPAKLRVLDADAWREHSVELRQAEPELVIG